MVFWTGSESLRSENLFLDKERGKEKRMDFLFMSKRCHGVPEGLMIKCWVSKTLYKGLSVWLNKVSLNGGYFLFKLLSRNKGLYCKKNYCDMSNWSLTCVIPLPPNRLSWLSCLRKRRPRLPNRWRVSGRKRASWMQRLPSGTTTETTSSCWPSRCVWSWWRWRTSPGTSIDMSTIRMLEKSDT